MSLLKFFKNKKAISAILMIFVISLIFTALFFSIQKIYAYDDCGDQAQWGEDCDAEEMMCLMIDPLGMEPWGYPAGDSTSGCWSGMCCGDDSDEYAIDRTCDNANANINPNPYSCATDSEDKACCNSENACVHNGCYSSGSHAHDVDVNGDDEYCLNNTWYDCYDTGDCDPVGEYAYTESSEACISGECHEACTSNDCIYQRYEGNGDCDSSNACYNSDCIQDTTYSTVFVGTGMCDNNVGAICTGGASDNYDVCIAWSSGDSCLIDHDWDDAMADCTGSNCIIASGGTYDVDNDGDLDVCLSTPPEVMWVDCTSVSHCGTGEYCSSNDCVACECTSVSDCCDGCFYKSAGTSCRADAGVCDVAETCTGSSATCPSNSYEPNGISCGTCKYCQSGSCTNVPAAQDPNSQCSTTGCLTGICNGSGACSYYTSSQHNCGSCKYCNSSGVCTSVTNSTDPYSDCSNCQYCQSGSCTDVTVGQDPLNDCGICKYCFEGGCVNANQGLNADLDPKDNCTLGSWACNGDSQKYRDSGYCVDETGACGVNDEIINCGTGEECINGVCVGCDCTSGDCCSDGCHFDAGGTICRADAGSCDFAESCTGSSATCPSNNYETDGTSCGTCKYCQSGSCEDAPPAEDPNSQCSTDGCLIGYCDGEGACSYYTSGQQNCATCKECNASGACIDVTTLTDPNNNCGTCQACYEGGCVDFSSGFDPLGDCSTTGCLTGTCNGSGACSYYTSSQHNCGSCKYCNSSGVCTSVTNSTDPYSDCSNCQYCQNGSCSNVTIGQDPSNDCGSCKYCFEGDCINVNTGINVDLDPKDNCALGSWTCNGDCQKYRNSGDCGDATGVCGINDEVSNIPTAYICSGGNEIAVSTSNYCLYWETCDDGDCAATKYYNSCNGSGSCRASGDSTNAITTDVYANSGYSLTAACGVTGTSYCSGTDNCSGDTRYTGYKCNGTTSCNVPTGEIGCCTHSKCTASGDDFCQYYNTGDENRKTSPTDDQGVQSSAVQLASQYVCAPAKFLNRGTEASSTDSINLNTSYSRTQTYTSDIDWWQFAGDGMITAETTYSSDDIDNFCFVYNYDPCTLSATSDVVVMDRAGAGTRYDLGDIKQGLPIAAGCSTNWIWIDLANYLNSPDISTIQMALFSGNSDYIREWQFGWKTSEIGLTDGVDSTWCCDQVTDCVDDAPAQGSRVSGDPDLTSSGCYNSGTTHDTDNDGDVDYCNSGSWIDCNNNDAHCGTEEECINGVCVGCECTSGGCCSDGCHIDAEGFVCRAGIDEICDIPEVCTGSSATCPTDAFLLNNTDCGFCKYCQSGVCVNVTTGTDPNIECSATSCNTGNCENGVCSYYTTGQHNCDYTFMCDNSGKCVSDPSADTAKFVNGVTIKSKPVSYDDNILFNEPIRLGGKIFGSFSGDVVINDSVQIGNGAYLIWGENGKVSLGTNGKIIFESASSYKIDWNGNLFDWTGTGQWYKDDGTLTDPSCNIGYVGRSRYKVIGTAPDSTWSSSLCYYTGSAYIYSGETSSSKSAYSVPYSGALVKTGSFIKSGPSVGIRACICVKDTPSNYTTYDDGLGFFAEEETEAPCDSDYPCPTGYHVITSADDQCRVWSGEGNQKIDWEGNPFEWEIETLYDSNKGVITTCGTRDEPKMGIAVVPAYENYWTRYKCPCIITNVTTGEQTLSYDWRPSGGHNMPSVSSFSEWCELESCTPDCVGKDCGDDGCGGRCGSCSHNEVCSSSDTCIKYYPPPGGGCFSPESLVLFQNGNLKEIQNVKINDKIWGWDFSLNQKILSKVEKVFVHDSEQYNLYRLAFSSNKIMYVTPEHRIYTLNRDWIGVGELTVGDQVLDINQKNNQAIVIDIKKNYQKEKIVYNFQTTTRNYFVNGILVHNVKIWYPNWDGTDYGYPLYCDSDKYME